MIYSDAKLVRQLEPLLQRLLIVDANLAAARLLSELVKDCGARRVVIEPSPARALAACREFEPQVIFTDLFGPELEGLKAVRELRRSTLACRQAPVIVVTAEATLSAIRAARNAGVHEFLRRPFTVRDLHRRLDASLLRPRDWVEGANYVGPDRRRFNSGEYQGPRKRRVDTGPATAADRVVQALRVAKAAMGVLERDQVQALRSLQVQGAELKILAAAQNDVRLSEATTKLAMALAGCAPGKALDRDALEAATADLWPYLPPDAANVA